MNEQRLIEYWKSFWFSTWSSKITCNNGFQNGTISSRHEDIPTLYFLVKCGKEEGRRQEETRQVKAVVLKLSRASQCSGGQSKHRWQGLTPRVSDPGGLAWNWEYVCLINSWVMPKLPLPVRVPHFENYWTGGKELDKQENPEQQQCLFMMRCRVGRVFHGANTEQRWLA